jgi:hypothetical protein
VATSAESGPASSTAATSPSTLTTLSGASQLMSKLGQLASDNPSKFKAATAAIAQQLAAKQSTETQELTKRATLQAELSRVEKTTEGQTATGPSRAQAPSSSLASAFTAASTTGTLAPVASASAASWTEEGLAGALEGALALVNDALGLGG